MNQREVDRGLFQKFLNSLTSEGSIRFIREHDMGASVRKEDLNELHFFIDEWIIPERYFLDKELDQKREYLTKVICDFLNELAQYTLPIDKTPERYSVALLERNTDQAKYFDICVKLNRLADKVALAYDDLVTTARNKLIC